MKYLSETGLAHFWSKIKSHVKTAISDINIGGRNLLPNTKTYTNISSGSGTIIDETYKDFSVRYLDCTQVATTTYKDLSLYNSIIDPEPGGVYTFSFYAKGTKIRAHFFGGSYNNSKGVSSQGIINNNNVDGSTDFTLTNEWTRYWVTYTLSNTTSSSTIEKKNVLLRVVGGNEAYVCGLKFERGNKPTDWSPALEDTTYDVATTSANGLMSSTDKTKLDGLKNYSEATTSTAGLMSASDKYKLDSMPSGGAFNPDRVLNVSYNSSTQKLTVASVVNGQTVTPPTTLNIHEGHSNFKRKVLYNDAAGTNGNVTLSEQKDNFDELVIVYGFANNEGIIVYKTETMPVVDGKQGFQLEYKYWTAVGKEANAHAIYITENGSTTLVVGHKDKYVINTSGDVQASSSSLGHIKVYKVYGIKYV